tara:strand:+ start:964 stop:1530 length:567 start_codon:yes stop_codon:yes gene_type:complete
MGAFDAAWSVLKAFPEEQMVHSMADQWRVDPLTGGTMHPAIQAYIARRGIERDEIDNPFFYNDNWATKHAGLSHPDDDLRYHMRYNVARAPEDWPTRFTPGIRENHGSLRHWHSKEDEEQLERGSVFGDEHDYYDAEADEYYRPRHHGDEGIIDLDESGTAQRRKRGLYGIGRTRPYYPNYPDWIKQD